MFRVKNLITASILALVVATGCSNWERTTFQTLSASKATIDQAQQDYETKQIPQDQASFQIINTAKIAQTTAVNDMVAYEQLKAAGAAPTALQTAQIEVISNLAQLAPDIASIKALYVKGGK